MDVDQSTSWFLQAAESGDNRAQCLIADWYKSGHRISYDVAKAAYWYRKAADQGDEEAQYELALLYRNGEGVQKDNEQAVFGFAKPPSKETPTHNLSWVGITRHRTVLGDLIPMPRLGIAELLSKDTLRHSIALDCFLQRDKGVPQSYKEAQTWFRKAADQGHEEARVSLGLSYELWDASRMPW